ncbi:hypothetical protein [Clostridium sp.]|uniref:hypothetical protein n=1 Tax=Clostridium sp. TaxID=1506 RepID=UPI003D6CAA27
MKATVIDASTWFEIVTELGKQLNITFEQALEIVYNSKMYKLREDENTGMYCKAPLDIVDLIKFEMQGQLEQALLDGN